VQKNSGVESERGAHSVLSKIQQGSVTSRDRVGVGGKDPQEILRFLALF
jgi:hypothetical protein